jgi:hypothetical protein
MQSVVEQLYVSVCDDELLASVSTGNFNDYLNDCYCNIQCAFKGPYLEADSYSTGQEIDVVIQSVWCLHIVSFTVVLQLIVFWL